MATSRRRNKGVSLSRVPALALGTFLVVAGLYFVYMEHGFPRLSQFPSGTAHVNGKAFFGLFGLNGWSGELTVAAGGLLLLGAAQHSLAKTASFVVAVVFAGVGLWALADHHSALGLFAANIWTVLLWFAAAAYLLINVTLPRVGGSTQDDTRAEPAPTAEPAAATEPAPTAEPVPTTEPVPTAGPTATETTQTTPASPPPTTDDQGLRRPATHV